jgi:hypothetical protein
VARPITREALLREAAEDSLLQEAHRRRFLYSDVERLIEEGILTHNVVLNGVVVTFRSLSGSDYADLLNATYPEMALVYFHQQLVAKAVFKIMGLPVAEPEENFWVKKFWVEELPIPFLRVFVSVVEGLNLRASRAANRTEAFCYEPYSRQLWLMIGRSAPYGRSEMGLVRRLWVAHNMHEDERLSDARQWEHTRAFIGTQSYKYAKKLAEHDRTWEEREKSRRKRIIEDAVNYIIQGPKEEQEDRYITVEGKNYLLPKVREASSLEDLEDELNRWIAGEKDYHDVVVEDYEKQVRHQFEARRTAQAEKRQKAQEMEGLLEQAGIQQPQTALVGYTAEQLKEMGKTFQRRVSTEATSQNVGRLYNRYMKNEARKGWIGDGGRVEIASEAAKTPDSNAPSLQEQLEGRKPSLFPTPSMDSDKVRGSDG